VALVIVSLLASVWPALRAMKVNAIEALKYE
jgi:ABC-type lipoprotein release transport system permease subunit